MYNFQSQPLSIKDLKTPRTKDQSCLMNFENISIGIGKTMVEFFSVEIVESVCRYLSCRAAGDSDMISEASFRARDAFCSPSAAITLALASLVASASAAIALCRF